MFALSSGLVRLRHKAELLNAEIFTTLYEAQVLIERWRRHYNAVRPHSSLGYRPPAPETVLPPAFNLVYAALRPAQTLATERRVNWYSDAGQANRGRDLLEALMLAVMRKADLIGAARNCLRLVEGGVSDGKPVAREPSHIQIYYPEKYKT